MIKYDGNELLSKQEELDSAIRKAKGLTPETIFTRLKVAFLVEVCEYANSVEFFKYGKENGKEDYDNQLEEYVDALHFLLSMGNHLIGDDMESAEFYPKDMSIDTLPEIMLEITDNLYNVKLHPNFVHSLVLNFQQLGAYSGFTNEMVLAKYEEKYKVNVERLNSGY